MGYIIGGPLGHGGSTSLKELPRWYTRLAKKTKFFSNEIQENGALQKEKHVSLAFFRKQIRLAPSVPFSMSHPKNVCMFFFSWF